MKAVVQGLGILIALGVGLFAANEILRLPDSPTSQAAREAHGEHAASAEEDSFERGPHRGRMLRDGDFALEVSIFETGIPPEFRVFASFQEQPIAPAEVDLTIELARLGNRVDRIGFAQQGDYLRGDREVEEPHSFDVVVVATHQGRESRWAYASHEGRVELSPEAVRAAKIEVETAGPATVRRTVRLNGRISANEDRMVHLIPRFPGVVRQTLKRLGDSVEKGELVAVVQSNESLQSYEVRSQVRGTVIKKHVTIGEFVAEGEEIYVVADLSTVWVDFNVYQQDFSQLAVGQNVVVDAGEDIEKAEGSISYISPFGAPSTQTMLARVELPNPSGQWRPGLFVTGEVAVEEADVPVAVSLGALQSLRDWTVVFVQEGRLFEARPVELGRRDSHRVEVLSGLEAGQQFVATNSFIVKAELGKAGASHDH